MHRQVDAECEAHQKEVARLKKEVADREDVSAVPNGGRLLTAQLFQDFACEAQFGIWSLPPLPPPPPLLSPSHFPPLPTPSLAQEVLYWKNRCKEKEEGMSVLQQQCHILKESLDSSQEESALLSRKVRRE